jgi:glutathione S-transferase
MIRLHYHPGNASFAPAALLRELAVPHELALVDRANAAHKSPAYLRLNPNGLIPVLEHDELVLYETAAICLHLVDCFPSPRLAPPVGTPGRAQFYKWLIWLSSTLQSALITYFYPERWVAEGNAEGARQVRAAAQAKVTALLAQIDDQLASHGGPWLLGADYGAADLYAFMLCRWTRGFDRQPARDFAHIGPWMRRVLARPAVAETVAFEQWQPPLM